MFVVTISVYFRRSLKRMPYERLRSAVVSGFAQYVATLIEIMSFDGVLKIRVAKRADAKPKPVPVDSSRTS
jgi:hypothetical protein